MKHDLNSIVRRVSHVLEIAIGLVLTLAVILAIVGVVIRISPAELLEDPEVVSDYLHVAATVVLTIEFINMLCTHTLDSVVEVLMMVIARQMIITHGTPVQNLISCMAIALLFVIRKFLFIPYLDQIPESKKSIVGSVVGLFRKKPAKGGMKETGDNAVQAVQKTEE